MSKLEELSEAMYAWASKLSMAILCVGISLAVALAFSPTKTVVLTWETLMHMGIAVVGLNAVVFVSALLLEGLNVLLYRRAMRKLGRS